MFKKILFSNMTSYFKPDDSELTKIESVLRLPNIIAMNTLDGQNYTIYVQKDIQRTASAFGIKVCDITCAHIVDAVEVVSEYRRVIKVNLVEHIHEYFNNKEALKSGNIDFINLYQDKQTLNSMVSAVNYYYGDNSFSTLSSICKKFAISLDLSKIEFEINSNMLKREQFGHRGYTNYDANVKKLYSILTNIRNANCFSRETFAMLYVRLEEYVTKEKEINYLLELIDGKNEFLKTVLIEDENV